MTIQEYRDKLAEEYDSKSKRECFQDGFDAAAEHIEKLEKVLDLYADQKCLWLEVEDVLAALPWRINPGREFMRQSK
jgi:hypothetical protein